MQSLDKQIQRISLSLATYSQTYQKLDLEPGESMQLIERALTQLKSAKRQLQSELESAYLDSAQQEEVDRLQALPGYSSLVATMVASVFDRNVKSDRSRIAFSGMDISIRESGTWKGRGKLTKRGNSYFRKRLYSAAWGAVMNYPEVRRY